MPKFMLFGKVVEVFGVTDDTAEVKFIIGLLVLVKRLVTICAVIVPVFACILPIIDNFCG